MLNSGFIVLSDSFPNYKLYIYMAQSCVPIVLIMVNELPVAMADASHPPNYTSEEFPRFADVYIEMTLCSITLFIFNQ